MTDHLAELRAERAAIAQLLEAFEGKTIVQEGPDAQGELTVEVSEERMASLRRQLAVLDRQIAELGETPEETPGADDDG